jgi:hypothetical protein
MKPSMSLKSHLVEKLHLNTNIRVLHKEVSLWLMEGREYIINSNLEVGIQWLMGKDYHK